MRIFSFLEIHLNTILPILLILHIHPVPYICFFFIIKYLLLRLKNLKISVEYWYLYFKCCLNLYSNNDFWTILTLLLNFLIDLIIRVVAAAVAFIN